ncbi:GNAT family N-acetyltransferase [Vibrio sp. JPW-9-11-11]|uniref:GNAT family N-acetyltransferase n=1 Tax=Vibrio sp. JPW-9-11-11 TaxID=1416532 RepID=UPI001592CF84|nr:GNAT family N-acetyltransferase [Vibrio sp. JPW-9-11-11]NVD08094.1 GNAT family N-acetyltransferase [Vibrio sp. JPW-9-11-11]
MTILYRAGTLEECVQVVQQIAEFAHKETVESLSARLDGKVRYLVQVAQEGDNLLGFKIGYQLDAQTFYSWFGGVSPLARNKGVAQQLLDIQERWAREQGYNQLKVKSRNQFPSMLRLLLRNGYMIEKFEAKQPLDESRIHFIKPLRQVDEN